MSLVSASKLTCAGSYFVGVVGAPASFSIIGATSTIASATTQMYFATAIPSTHLFSFSGCILTTAGTNFQAAQTVTNLQLTFVGSSVVSAGVANFVFSAAPSGTANTVSVSGGSVTAPQNFNFPATSSLSVSLSAYTCCYATLEYYYGNYALAADAQIAADPADEGELPADAADDEHAGRPRRRRSQSQMELSHDLHDTLRSFRHDREGARQALWWSLLFLMATPMIRLGGGIVNEKSAIKKAALSLCCFVLASGAFAVRRTVRAFRRSYRPLITEHLGKANWEFVRSPSNKRIVIPPCTTPRARSSPLSKKAL